MYKINFKSVKLILSATVISIFGLTSCSDDGTNVNVPNCPDSEILGIQFQGSSNTTRFGAAEFLSNTPGTLIYQSGPNQNFTTNNFQTQLDMHDGAYNSINGRYVNVDNHNATLYDVSNNGILTTPAIPTTMGTINAPEFVNGTLYFGNADFVLGNLVFNILDANYAVLNSTTISSPSTSVNYYPSFTVTTNGTDMLYYVIGTQLITYNITTNTISQTLIGAFNYPGNLLGVEYVDASTLLVLRHEFNGADTDLVKLDITNISNVVETNVVNLGYKVNEETFSTTYDACNKRYFIVTNLQDFSTTNYTRVALSPTIPVVSTSANTSIYVAGIKMRN